MNKKIVKVVLIICAVILICILIENAIKGFSNVSEEIISNKEIKKQEEIYYNSEEYKTVQYIESSIEKAVELVNKNDYNSLYDLLDEEYKDFMRFTSVNEFTSYLNDYWGKAEKIRLVNQKLIRNRYICTVGVTVNSIEQNYRMLVNKLNDDNFSLIFDNISYIKSPNDEYIATDTNFKYNVRHIVQKTNSLIYAVDISNTTSKAININFDKISLLKTSNVYYDVTNLELLKNISIDPGEVKRINLEFDISSGNSYEDLLINISYTDSKGKKYSANLMIDEDMGY